MTEVGDKFTKKLDFSHTGIGEPNNMHVDRAGGKYAHTL